MINYDEIPAGREMDALVAEKVMGWKHVGNWEGDDRYHPVDAIWADGDGNTLPPDPWPHYSTNIAAAWKVVEKMISVGTLKGTGDVVLYYVNNDGCYYDDVGGAHWYCAVCVYEDGPEYDFDDDGVRADTAALAICRAALKAVDRGR